MYRLSRAIDPAVGIDLSACNLLRTGIITVVVAIRPAGAGLVVIRIGKHLPTLVGVSFGFEDKFTLLVGHALEGVVGGIGDVLLDAQMRPGDGLTRVGIHHHVALVVVVLRLPQYKHVAHEVQASHGVDARRTGKLKHIHADGQCGYGELILEELVVFLVLIPACLLVHHLSQHGLECLVVLLRRRTQRDVAIGLHLIDLHGDRPQVAQVLQFQVGGLSRHGHGSVEVQFHLGVSQFHLLVTQFVGALPAAPFAQGLAYEGNPLLGRFSMHAVKACKGQFASLGQVLIRFQQLVEFLHRRVVTECVGSSHTGRPAVTRPVIVFVECRPVVELDADDAQQVVPEDFAVVALHHEWHILVFLHLGQLVAELIGELWPAHQPYRVVLVAYLVEHRLIYRLHHLVGGLVVALLDAHYLRLQRVGSYLRHHLCRHELGFQQVAVVFAFLGLLHDFLQQFILALGQVFHFSQSHFLPHGGVIFAKDKHWYHQCK